MIDEDICREEIVEYRKRIEKLELSNERKANRIRCLNTYTNNDKAEIDRLKRANAIYLKALVKIRDAMLIRETPSIANEAINEAKGGSADE